MLTFRPKKKSYKKQHAIAILLVGSTLAFCGYNESQKETFKPIPISSPMPRVEQVSRGEVDREEFQKEKVIKAINNNLAGNLGEIIYLSSKEQKVNSMMVAAIIKWETANLTSNLAKNHNNFGGLNYGTRYKQYKKHGRYASFPDKQTGINEMVKLLKENYIDLGLNSLDKIKNKYCPDSDHQNGMYGMSNEGWLPNVTEIYNKILKEAKQ